MPVSPRQPGRAALFGVLLTLVVASGLLAAAPSASAKRRLPSPTTHFELPFVCQQAWTGGTRARHSPSRHAVDFNRRNDLGKAVVAAAPGRVSVANNKARGGYGKYVVIDHGQGESTLYAHLKNLFVTPGTAVDQGTLIGAVGSTGNSSGPHLHLEQKVGRDIVPAHFGGSAYRTGTSASGNCADVPLAGNLTGDRAAELTVFRRTRRGDFLVRQPDGAAPRVMRLGGGTEEPLLGDWNGDGAHEPGVWNPRGRMFKLAGEAGVRKLRFGRRGDRPVAGDWDGDGAWEVGVYRPRLGTFLLRSASGGKTRVSLGDAGQLPVTGDWNGDGRTDVGLFDQATATFTLRHEDRSGAAVVSTVVFGAPGDLPVTGDWDGNGTTELGTWTPSTAVFNLRRAKNALEAARSVATVPFGRPRGR